MKKVDKRTMKFSLLRSKIHHDLSNCLELNKMIEKFLVSERKRLGEKFCKEATGLCEEEKDYLLGWYDSDFIQLQEVFPRLQRCSLFVTTFSSFESNLIALCRAMAELLTLETTYSKPRSRSIDDDALEFLEQRCLVKMKRILPYRETISKLRRLRNCIVHGDGKLNDRNPNELKVFFSKMPSILINDRDVIILRKGFVEIVIHEIKNFFEMLIYSCKERLNADLANAN